MGLLKRLLPWGIALIIFYYLFKKYPITNLGVALSYVQLPYFLGFSIMYFVIVWWLDCWALSRFFSRVGSITSARELFVPRLASYLVMLVNYAAGQGALAWFFKREKNLPFLKSTSLVSFIVLIDLYWIVSLAFFGSCFSDLSSEKFNFLQSLRILWVITTIGIILLAFLGKPLMKNRLFNWTSRFHIFSAFRDRNFSDYGYTLSIRFPLHMIINTSFFFFAWTFSVHISFITVLTYLPIIMLLGTIPLTPGGLGVVQLVTVTFFADKISGEVISSGQVSASEMVILISLSAQMINFLLKGITGMFFLRHALSSEVSTSTITQEIHNEA